MMICDEKGASKLKNDMTATEKKESNSARKSVGKDISSDKKAKNSKIEDFFKSGMTENENTAFSAKKRLRDEDYENINKQSDKENANKFTDKDDRDGRKEIINLLDDESQSDSPNETKPQLNGLNGLSPKSKRKHIHKLKNSTDSKTKQSEESGSETNVRKAKRNRDVCSICRDGGDLLLCDNCPKSFHMKCLKLKSSDIPEGNWHCPGCIPIIEKRKQKQEGQSTISLEEKRKIKNEKKRLYRMKKKEEKMKRLQSEGGESGLRNTPSKSFRSLSKNKNLKKKQGNKQESESKPRNLNLNFEMFLKAGGSNEYPLIPIISDSMQSKILEEQKRMDNSLFNKINNGIMRNFLLKGKSKSKAVNADGVIDLTQEEENNSINNSPSSNKLPTEEEAKAAFEAITKNGVINLIALNDIAKSDPILYYKMNNLYLSNPILSNNSITSANTTSLLTQKPNISANVKRIYKYPIEDEEVYKNPEIHNIPQDFLNKPSGKAPLIPNDHISIIFKIWDFLQTFKSKLNISEFSPEQLYFSLKHFSEEEIPLITEIHTVLLFIIGEQIRKYDYTTLLANEDYEVMLIKLALENTSLSSRLVFKKSWPEIIRLVIHSGNQAFSLMVTEELNNISQKLRHLTTKSYNLALTYEEKVGILEYLVNTVVNSDFVREIVKEDIEKRTLLNREKSDLHNELKANEIRKKEIERQEKFTQPRQKVDSLTARLQTLVEDNQHLSRQELTKLRKELEQEREQFKSVIKEGEEIETIKNKITSRIEKLSNEIFEIPSTNKKLIGTDGLKDEYYFYPSANNKLYVKKRTSIGGVKKYEWRELTTEEEIKELLSKLSEKGVNEKNLLTKIKKLYPKRLKVSTAQDEDINMIEDKTQRVDEENILKSALEWKNTQMDKWNKKFDKTEDNTFQEFVENLLTLEEKVTEYLFQDEKEWESHDVRQNWKAWLTYIDDISEYSKCLIMFNNKFRNPYKINDFLGGKSKIINDEEETYQSYIFTEDNKLAPNKVNPHRTIAPKSKLWSKELEGMEDIYVDYVANGVKSMPGLFLAYYIFDAVFNDLVRRREIYKKKDLGLGTNFEDENYYNTHSSNSVSNVNNFNNVNNVNSSNPVKNKKIINDEMDIDDFCYNEEAYTGVNGYKNKSSEFMVEIDISGKESYLNEESVRTRSRRLGGGSKTTTSSGLSQPKRKNIDWHDECYVCYEVGDLICCEDCPNVVHLSCAKLKKTPETWRCEDCLLKLTNKRFTRSSRY